jgi:catechol 2,3-dioxygenase-like lactoylglutathione lyase family enzyme
MARIMGALQSQKGEGRLSKNRIPKRRRNPLRTRSIVQNGKVAERAMKDFNFHHAAISVPSLDEAIDWYSKVLGYEVEKHFFVAPAKARAAMLRKGALRVEVFEPQDAAQIPSDRLVPISDLLTNGNKHAAYRVDDMEAAITDLESKGVEPVFVVREAFGRAFFIRDCAGNLLEFVEETAD